MLRRVDAARAGAVIGPGPKAGRLELEAVRLSPARREMPVCRAVKVELRGGVRKRRLKVSDFDHIGRTGHPYRMTGRDDHQVLFPDVA